MSNWLQPSGTATTLNSLRQPTPEYSGIGEFLCSSAYYSVTNLAPGYSVHHWNGSNNVSFPNGDTGNPVLVAPGSDGNGWVQAVLNTGAGLYTMPAKSFWVGTPPPGISPLHDPNCNYCQVSYGQVGTEYMITAQTDNPSTYIYDYYWEIYPPEGSGWDEGYTDYGKLIYYSPPVAGTYIFKLKQNWTCGWSEFEEVERYFYESYRLLFTPNPTTGETTLSIESTSEEKTFDETARWDLEIFTETQVLKTIQTGLRGRNAKIQTAGWQEGIYLVRVNYKGEILTGKLMVKK